MTLGIDNATIRPHLPINLIAVLVRAHACIAILSGGHAEAARDGAIPETNIDRAKVDGGLDVRGAEPSEGIHHAAFIGRAARDEAVVEIHAYLALVIVQGAHVQGLIVQGAGRDNAARATTIVLDAGGAVYDGTVFKGDVNRAAHEGVSIHHAAPCFSTTALIVIEFMGMGMGMGGAVCKGAALKTDGDGGARDGARMYHAPAHLRCFSCRVHHITIEVVLAAWCSIHQLHVAYGEVPSRHIEEAPIPSSVEGRTLTLTHERQATVI